MKKCFRCKVPLISAKLASKEQFEGSKYDHEEHIIPNNVGGKLTCMGMACAYCGSKFGLWFESELEKFCRPFSIFANIERDRKEVQPLEMESEKGNVDRIHSKGKRERVLKGKPNLP